MSKAAEVSPIKVTWKPMIVPPAIIPKPIKVKRVKHSNKFINDGVSVAIYNKPRKKPIIPDYSAMEDKACRTYFESPRVEKLLRITLVSLSKWIIY